MIDKNNEIQFKSLNRDEIQNILSIFCSSDFQNPGEIRSLFDIREQLQTLIDSESSDEESLYDFQMLQFLDQNLLNLKKNSSEDSEILESIYNHLELMSSVTNLLPGMELYSSDELAEIIIDQNKNYDKLKLFHTMRQSRTDQLKHEYCLIFLDYIDSEKKFNLQPTEQLIFHALLFDTLWENYGSLSFDDRTLICNNFFLFSLSLDVPLESNLKKFFYSTTTPLEFINECSAFYLDIEKNEEELIINEKSKQVEKLIISVKNCIQNFNNQKYSKDQLKNVILKLYPEMNEYFQKILLEATNIVIQIDNGSIIDRNVGGEPDASDDLNRDMVQLIKWFSNRSDWVKICEYFKQPQTFVPKDFYFDKIRKSFDFSVPDDVDTLSSFSSTLRENGVIKDELFTFDENTDQFVWNKNLY